MGPTFKQIMFQCAVHVQLTPCGKCHSGNGLRNSSQKKKKKGKDEKSMGGSENKPQ